MEQVPSREADTQPLYETQNFNYYVNKSLQMEPTRSQKNPVHTI
jgi:hypothetical protein